MLHTSAQREGSTALKQAAHQKYSCRSFCAGPPIAGEGKSEGGISPS